MSGDNDYPNVDNYPEPSFKSPIPAPDYPGDSGDLLYVAYTTFWAEVLAAACMALLQPSTWQGTHDEIILAQNRANDLLIALQTPVTPPADSVPTPYWDEDSEVDDELPTDAQPWYGTVSNPEAPADELDFVENAAIWITTGFLAIATWEIGAAPAILFHTIAPRFVLATKRGDLGEIIRILVDGEEAARVDTSGYAPGDIIRTPILPDPAITTGHDIIIVQVS